MVPLQTSGAKKKFDPAVVVISSQPFSIMKETPKSAILTTSLSANRRFSGLISL
jgi:hypothetical protein